MLAQCCTNVFDVGRGWNNVESALKTTSTAMRSRKAVSAYFTSKQILLFGSSEQYTGLKYHPASTRRWANVGLMLGQRCRRWSNIKPTLGKRRLLSGWTIHSGDLNRPRQKGSRVYRSRSQLESWHWPNFSIVFHRCLTPAVIHVLNQRWPVAASRL